MAAARDQAARAIRQEPEAVIRQEPEAVRQAPETADGEAARGIGNGRRDMGTDASRRSVAYRTLSRTGNVHCSGIFPKNTIRSS